MGEKGPVSRRRHRSKLERRRIVEESLRTGASVTQIAHAHGVRANQVFHWRKLYREGRLETASAELLPVRISEEQPRIGSIHIDCGKVRIHVEGAVDQESLRLVLEHAVR